MSEYICNRLACCLGVTLNHGFCVFCWHLKRQDVCRERGGLGGGVRPQYVILFFICCAHLPQETNFCFLLKGSASFCIRTMS